MTILVELRVAAALQSIVHTTVQDDRKRMAQQEKERKGRRPDRERALQLLPDMLNQIVRALPGACSCGGKFIH